jgi:hypothetical protein
LSLVLEIVEAETSRPVLLGWLLNQRIVSGIVHATAEGTSLQDLQL